MPANVIIRYSEADDLWNTLVRNIENHMKRTSEGVATVSLPVKDYDLSDHQFIQLKVEYGKIGERIIRIPRP